MTDRAPRRARMASIAVLLAAASALTVASAAGTSDARSRRDLATGPPRAAPRAAWCATGRDMQPETLVAVSGPPTRVAPVVRGRVIGRPPSPRCAAARARPSTERATVPDVVGLPVPMADAVLATAGLGVRPMARTDRSVEGATVPIAFPASRVVAWQRPVGGARVPAGTVVAIGFRLSTRLVLGSRAVRPDGAGRVGPAAARAHLGP